MVGVHVRRCRCFAISNQCARRGARRSSATPRGHTLARDRDGRRLEPGCSACLGPRHLSLLGRRVRLARSRSPAESLRPVRHAHRWARHPLRASAVATSRGKTVGHHSRLARLDRRVPQGHRAVDQPDSTWGPSGRRLPCDAPHSRGSDFPGSRRRPVGVSSGSPMPGRR